MKIPREHHISQVLSGLEDFPVVAIVGSRQIGKSTLARDISERLGGTHYFDLERTPDRRRLQDPYLALESLEGLVILDEAQLMPELFPLLRVLADRPDRPAQFLVLGSASPSLSRQLGESLAGRIHYHDLGGLNLSEVGLQDMNTLWLRGGIPPSYTSNSDRQSYRWRQNFVRTYLTRDLGVFGFELPQETMRRLWTMLAHLHGQTANISQLAGSLGIQRPRVREYIDALKSTYMIRTLYPWFENTKKREVKAPKVYLADTGILHYLLRISTYEELMSDPIAGASWESWAMSEIISRLELDWEDCYFWGIHGGAELDLFTFKGGKRIGYEFKLSSAPRTTRSMHSALEALDLDKLYVVYSGDENWPMAPKIESAC